MCICQRGPLCSALRIAILLGEALVDQIDNNGEVLAFIVCRQDDRVLVLVCAHCEVVILVVYRKYMAFEHSSLSINP